MSVNSEFQKQDSRTKRFTLSSLPSSDFELCSGELNLDNSVWCEQSEKLNRFRNTQHWITSRKILERCQQHVSSNSRSVKSRRFEKTVLNIVRHTFTEIVDKENKAGSAVLNEEFSERLHRDEACLSSWRVNDRTTRSSFSLSYERGNDVTGELDRRLSMNSQHRSAPSGLAKWRRGAACSKINKNKWISKYSSATKASPGWTSQESVYVVDTEAVTVKVENKSRVGRGHIPKRVPAGGPPPARVRADHFGSGVSGSHSSVLPRITRSSVRSSAASLEHCAEKHFSNTHVSKNNYSLTTCRPHTSDSYLLVETGLAVPGKDKLVPNTKTSLDNHVHSRPVDEANDPEEIDAPDTCCGSYTEIKSYHLKNGANYQKPSKKVKRLNKAMPKSDRIKHRKDDIQLLSSKTCYTQERMKNKLHPDLKHLSLPAAHQTRKAPCVITDSVASLKYTYTSPKTKTVKPSQNDNVVCSQTSTSVFNTGSDKTQKHMCKTAAFSLDDAATSTQNIVKRKSRRHVCKPFLERSESELESVSVSYSSLKPSGVSSVKRTKLTSASVPTYSTNPNFDRPAEATRGRFKLNAPDTDIVKQEKYFFNEPSEDRFPLGALSQGDDKELKSVDEHSDCLDVYSISSNSSPAAGGYFSVIDLDAVKEVDSNSSSAVSASESEVVSPARNTGRYLPVSSVNQSNSTEKDAKGVNAGIPHDIDMYSTVDQGVDDADGRYLYIENCETGTSNVHSLVVERLPYEVDKPCKTTSYSDQISDSHAENVPLGFSSHREPHWVCRQEKVSPVNSFSQYRESSEDADDSFVYALNDGIVPPSSDIDDVDGEYGCSLAVQTSHESDSSKKHVPRDSCSQDPSDEEIRGKNDMDVEYTITSSVQSLNKRSSILSPDRHFAQFASTRPEVISSNVFNSNFNIANFCDSELSNHDSKKTVLSDDNMSFPHGLQDKISDVINLFEKSSDRNANENFIPRSCEHGFAQTAHNDHLVGSSLNCNKPELELARTDVLRRLLSSCQHEDCEDTQPDPADEDESEKCRKSLEDMLDSLREAETWVSQMNSHNLESLSDVQLEGVVIDESGINCTISITDDDLQQEYFPQPEDLYLLQEAMSCLGSGIVFEDEKNYKSNESKKSEYDTSDPDESENSGEKIFVTKESKMSVKTTSGLLEDCDNSVDNEENGHSPNERDNLEDTLSDDESNASRDNTPDTKESKKSESKTFGCFENSSGNKILCAIVPQTAVTESPNSTHCEDVCVNSQNEQQTDSVPSLTVPNPQVKVVVEKLDLEKMCKIGDVYLDKIGTSWKLRYDSKSPNNVNGTSPDKMVNIGSKLSQNKIGHQLPDEDIKSFEKISTKSAVGRLPEYKMGSKSILDSCGSSSPEKINTVSCTVQGKQMNKELTEYHVSGTASAVKVKTTNKRVRPSKPKQTGSKGLRKKQQPHLKESVFKCLDFQPESDNGKSLCESSPISNEQTLQNKHNLSADAESENECSQNMEGDLLDSTEFGKAITASKLKIKKRKKPKIFHQTSTENYIEIDKSQDFKKSDNKLFPLDALGKPKSKLVQKILRQREKEKAASKQSSLPCLQIAPFKDIISSNCLNLTNSSAFGFPPKVTFGRSFRKNDQSKLHDCDTDRHRSPLELCLDANAKIKFNTVKEPHVSLFQSSTDRNEFVFGNTSGTNDVSLQGKTGFQNVSENAVCVAESPCKDSTIKSELLSRLESVLNSSHSIAPSPTAPSCSTPLDTWKKQQIVMFSPTVQSMTVTVTNEYETFTVASGQAKKSILKNSTSNILAELKGGHTTTKPVRQKCLKMEDVSCTDPMWSLDCLKDSYMLQDDFVWEMNSHKEDPSVTNLGDSSRNIVSCTMSTDLEDCETFQKCFAESTSFQDSSVQMASECEAQSDGQKGILVEPDDMGTKAMDDSSEVSPLDTAGNNAVKNTVTSLSSGGDGGNHENGLILRNVERFACSRNVSSSEDNINLGKGLEQIDSDLVGSREADEFDKTDVTAGSENSTVWESSLIKDEDHYIVNNDDTTKPTGDPSHKDICTSIVNDTSTSTASNLSALQISNLSNISVFDPSLEPASLYDSTPDTEEDLEGDASQVEGSLLALSLISDSISNSEFEEDVQSDSLRCCRSNNEDEEPEDGDSTEMNIVVGARDHKQQDESGSDGDDDCCDRDSNCSSAGTASSSSGTARPHTSVEDKEHENLDDDKDEDAISLLAPSEASFLSDCIEDAEDTKSIKGQLKCTSSVTHTESESTIAEKDSNENNSGEQSGEPKDSLVTTAVKIGEKKLVTTCGQPDDKASILKGTQSLTLENQLQMLRRLVAQKNLFRCLDVVKQMERGPPGAMHPPGERHPVELPVDIQMGILDTSLHYANMQGAFLIVDQLYSTPHLLTTHVCNRVIRTCHPFRRDCVPELSKLFDCIRSVDVMPDLDCLLSLVRTFIESGSVERVWQVLKYAGTCPTFILPVRVHEMALQMCLDEPRAYSRLAIGWLHDMLVEHRVQYLSDVNPNILVNLAQLCIDYDDRDVAVHLKAAIEPTSTITIGFEEKDNACLVYSSELEMFAGRIKGCGLMKNWRYLAQTYVDVCGSRSVFNRQLVNVYCDVFLRANTTQQVVSSFAEFLRDVIKEFERDCQDNPTLNLDYSTIGQMGRSLLFHCYHGNHLKHCYTLLSMLLEFKLPCRSGNPVVDQQFLTVAMETCIHMEDYRRCVQIFEGFSWRAENVPSAEDLHRFLLLVFKLVERSDCKTSTRILTLILSQKQVCEMEVFSQPEFVSLQNELICRSVHVGDMASAVKLYELHTAAFGRSALDVHTLRLLVVSCAESGLVGEARAVFARCRTLNIYHEPGVAQPAPHQLLLSSRLTPAELRFVVEVFLQELHRHLRAGQTPPAVHALSHRELELSLKIVMYETEVGDDPYLSVFPRSVPAAQNMVLSIVHQDLDPPLAASVIALGLIKINWNTLEIYLQALDQKGNQQCLRFTKPPYIGAPHILPPDRDSSQPMYKLDFSQSWGHMHEGPQYDQGMGPSQPYRHGTAVCQRFGPSRPPEPSGAPRARREGRASHTHPVPLASLTLPNPGLLQPFLPLPPPLHDQTVPPDRLAWESSCPPHLVGGPHRQVGRGGLRLQHRPPRARGQWLKKPPSRNEHQK